MKYYGKSSLSSFLKWTLNIMLVIGVILFIFVSINTLSDKSLNEVKLTLSFIYGLFIIGTLSLIFIVYNLKKMINTLITKEPFVRENVIYLRNIWIGSFIISICYFINFFINSNYRYFEIIYIDSNGIHTDLEFFIFFFASLFILVLQKVFEMAVQYKEENDLTI